EDGQVIGRQDSHDLHVVDQRAARFGQTLPFGRKQLTLLSTVVHDWVRLIEEIAERIEAKVILLSNDVPLLIHAGVIEVPYQQRKSIANVSRQFGERSDLAELDTPRAVQERDGKSDLNNPYARVFHDAAPSEVHPRKDPVRDGAWACSAWTRLPR